jgi:hypothetical protein
MVIRLCDHMLHVTTCLFFVVDLICLFSMSMLSLLLQVVKPIVNIHGHVTCIVSLNEIQEKRKTCLEFQFSWYLFSFVVMQEERSAGSVHWMGKINFVEIRSFWHIFRSFDRMWIFLILSLQVCCSYTFFHPRFTYL